MNSLRRWLRRWAGRVIGVRSFLIGKVSDDSGVVTSMMLASDDVSMRVSLDRGEGWISTKHGVWVFKQSEPIHPPVRVSTYVKGKDLDGGSKLHPYLARLNKRWKEARDDA